MKIQFCISIVKKKYMLLKISDATCLSTSRQLSLVCCNSSVIDCENQMTRAIILGNLFWTSFGHIFLRAYKIFSYFYVLAFLNKF